MIGKEKQGIEKLLKVAVIVLCIGILGAMALIVKATFFTQTSGPRTSIERQLFDAQKAIEKDPKDLRARLMLGVTYAQMGNYSEAEAEYLNVIKADKKYAKAYYLLALNYENQGKISKAIETLKNQEDEQSLFQIGSLYIKQKDYRKAIDSLKKALKKRPSASDSLYYLALAYEKQGNKKEAEKKYKEALKYAPDYELAKEGLARLK